MRRIMELSDNFIGGKLRGCAANSPRSNRGVDGNTYGVDLKTEVLE
jgi:hypothetical protein